MLYVTRTNTTSTPTLQYANIWRISVWLSSTKYGYAFITVSVEHSCYMLLGAAAHILIVQLPKTLLQLDLIFPIELIHLP